MAESDRDCAGQEGADGREDAAGREGSSSQDTIKVCDSDNVTEAERRMGNSCVAKAVGREEADGRGGDVGRGASADRDISDGQQGDAGRRRADGRAGVIGSSKAGRAEADRDSDGQEGADGREEAAGREGASRQAGGGVWKEEDVILASEKTRVSKHFLEKVKVEKKLLGSTCKSNDSDSGTTTECRVENSGIAKAVGRETDGAAGDA